MPKAARPDLHTTALRFDTETTGGLGVIGMEFAAPADFGDTAPLSDDDEAVLAGIAERLAAHGKIARFGVRLIRNPLGLSERELLHETSDRAHRMLHCTASERDALPADATIVETAWRFKLDHGTTTPTVMQDCTATCVRAGEGHDIQHSHTEPDVYD